VSERIEELEAYEGRVADDAATLLELLELREAIFRDLEQVMTYAQLRSAEDTRNQEYQAMSAKASSLGSEASSTISYLEPELQSLTEADVAAFVDDEPALAEYEHYLDDVLRMKAHTRSAEVEEVLADLSEVTDAPSEIYSMLTNADMTYGVVENPDGEEVEITQANFTKLQKNPDRKFRERVHETFYDEWAGVRNTVGTSLKKAVREHATSAEIRGYDSARQAALDGSNVPVEVYDTLVDTVDDNLDVLHRHAELKADALGVDQLESHDLYMSLTGDQGPDVAYEQAREWVIEAVAPLGEAYQERMAEGLDSRWVDVYENRGKRSGAFSSGTYDTQPYILMNYQDDIASMFTLAHELGHSMHSELSGDTQPWHDASYDIFVAEIASTVNETLLTHHLLDTVEDDELRTHVLDEYLERFRSTLFRQTMFAAFEQRIHERVEADDDALTPDAFDEIYADLKGDYYAPAELTGGVERVGSGFRTFTTTSTCTSTRPASPRRPRSSSASSTRATRPPPTTARCCGRAVRITPRRRRTRGDRHGIARTDRVGRRDLRRVPRRDCGASGRGVAGRVRAVVESELIEYIGDLRRVFSSLPNW